MRISLDICGEPFHALVEGPAVTFATFGEAPEAEPAPPDHPVAVALRAYRAGDLGSLDRIAVRQDGPAFRRQV